MKNKHGGNKAKKQKRCANELERKLVKADEKAGEEYGIITKLLGNCRVIVKLANNEKNERLGIICGQMKGRVFIEPTDLVIVSIREFQDNKVDIVYKYNSNEKSILKKEFKKVKDLLEHSSERETGGDIDWIAGDDNDNEFDVEEDDDELQENTNKNSKMNITDI